MSERRFLRLVSLALVIIGAGGTALAFTGFFDGTDGSLAFPLSALAGIIALIRYRPRTKRKKDTHV